MPTTSLPIPGIGVLPIEELRDLITKFVRTAVGECCGDGDLPPIETAITGECLLNHIWHGRAYIAAAGGVKSRLSAISTAQSRAWVMRLHQWPGGTQAVADGAPPGDRVEIADFISGAWGWDDVLDRRGTAYHVVPEARQQFENPPPRTLACIERALALWDGLSLPYLKELTPSGDTITLHASRKERRTRDRQMGKGQPTSPRAAAGRLAGLGWRVLPMHEACPRTGQCSCSHRECRALAERYRQGENVRPQAGKHPRVPETEASADPGQIAAWWGRWPTANVALVLPPGVILLDVDNAAGHIGLAVSQVRFGKLPATVAQWTGTGKHFLFRVPADLKTPPGVMNWRQGLDVLSPGAGRVTVAPSLHWTGNRYQWLPGCAPWEREVAAAPGWLVDRLAARS